MTSIFLNAGLITNRAFRYFSECNVHNGTALRTIYYIALQKGLIQSYSVRQQISLNPIDI